jgi:hypothetical protein
MSIAYMQAAENFVAGKVFPTVPVQKQSDKYFIYDKEYFHKSEMTNRAADAESAGADYALSSDTYYADVYALHKAIPDMVRANEDNPLNSDRDATNYLTQQNLIYREIQWASNFFTSSVWTTEYTGVAGPTASSSEFVQWSDTASDPIQDVQDAKQAVLLLTGIEPNQLTMGVDVYNKLLNHPDILDRINSMGSPERPAIVNQRSLAIIFDVDRVNVCKAIKNTANVEQTASNSFICSDGALLSYAPSAPALMTPSSGYTFEWTGYIPGGTRITTMRMESRRSDWIEIETTFDQKVVSADSAAFFTNVLA